MHPNGETPAFAGVTEGNLLPQPSRAGDVVRVGNGDGEGICGIAARDLCARQQAGHHGVHLRLVCIADADDRLLHQPGGIFADLDAGAGCGEQNDAARLPKFQRRLRVRVDEDFLDRRAIGPVGEDQIGQRAVQLQQACGKRILRIGRNLPVRHMRQAVPFCRDQAPAGRAEARIKAQNDQPSFSMISSETS